MPSGRLSRNIFRYFIGTNSENSDFIFLFFNDIEGGNSCSRALGEVRVPHNQLEI